MNSNLTILLIAMALTTYLVRMIPFTFFTATIKSKFLRDFLYYIPYAVLGAMTIPHIFYSGATPGASAVGAVVAFIMAFMRLPLLGVAAASCFAAFIAGLIF